MGPLARWGSGQITPVAPPCLHGSGERNGALRTAKVNFMIKALELLRLAKRHVSRQSKLNSEEI